MSLRRADVAADPLEQFRRWFADAREAVDVPEAMAIATATPDGRPSVRMVLLKRADEDGFVFHTSYEGRKGRELAANPRAALLFHWAPLGRQVRVEGPVERVSREESEAYFHTRAPKSRISALVSPQSEVVPDRETLERCVARGRRSATATTPPLPADWGGFRVAPGRVRVLAAPRRPPARPPALPPRRRRLGGRAPRAVSLSLEPQRVRRHASAAGSSVGTVGLRRRGGHAEVPLPDDAADARHEQRDPARAEQHRRRAEQRRLDADRDRDRARGDQPERTQRA